MQSLTTHGQGRGVGLESTGEYYAKMVLIKQQKVSGLEGLVVERHSKTGVCRY